MTTVAVIGASGIGKHHANWWTLEGARVVAFAGTSEDSVSRTAEMLKEKMGVEAQGYTNIAQMLDECRPDIVDICSPPAFHAGHVRQALEAGCQVLCEKPFVYEKGRSFDELRQEAAALVDLAEKRKLLLGLCTQYTAGAAIFRKLCNQQDGDTFVPHRYLGHLESPAKNRAPDPERVWVDLAPHLISVLQKLLPAGKIDWNGVQTDFNGYEAIARFTVNESSGTTCSCEIITRNITGPPANVRHFELNDNVITVEGGNDEEGVYCARVLVNQQEHQYADFMRLLIREFLAGSLLMDGHGALQNLDWLLRFIEIARAAKK